MANKTIKIFGNGYAPTGESASITATFNGNTVYSGTVPSLATSQIDYEPDAQVEIFSFDIDDTYYGNSAVTIQVTAGDQVTTSYAEINSAANPATFTRLALPSQQFDYRTGVTIDGAVQSKGDLADLLQGAWLWDIPATSTFACNMWITGGGDILPWVDTQGYPAGSYVLGGSTVYVSSQVSPTGTPLSNTAYWTVAGTWNS